MELVDDDEEETDVMFAKGIEGTKSSCQGDSGSPLVVRARDDKFTLAGVASYTTETNDTCAPGTKIAFIRISAVLEWIVENMG